MNFAPELSQIISEAKYLEKLGFQIPDLARNVALQEDKYIAFQDGLTHCLQRYHHALSTLSDAEVCFIITLILLIKDIKSVKFSESCTFKSLVGHGAPGPPCAGLEQLRGMVFTVPGTALLFTRHCDCHCELFSTLLKVLLYF